MENSVIAIHQSYVITKIVYALLAPVFFEMDNNVRGGGENFHDDDDNDKIYTQQSVAETDECKSPCPSTDEEICIEECA